MSPVTLSTAYQTEGILPQLSGPCQIRTGDTASFSRVLYLAELRNPKSRPGDSNP